MTNLVLFNFVEKGAFYINGFLATFRTNNNQKTPFSNLPIQRGTSEGCHFIRLAVWLTQNFMQMTTLLTCAETLKTILDNLPYFTQTQLHIQQLNPVDHVIQCLLYKIFSSNASVYHYTCHLSCIVDSYAFGGDLCQQQNDNLQRSDTL